ncbi:MAG: FliO/MopB family protein [Micavibrio sp.]
MDVINSLQLLKFGGALLFVLALMLGLSLIMRRFNSGSGLIAPNKRRLKIVEMMPLGARHRMILVKRDDREHLVILGPAGETVVESGITAPVETGKE